MPKVTFIPNDPLASGGPPTRQIAPGRFTGGDVATFAVQPGAAAGQYPPHTPGFDYWQAQTALIAGLRTWRSLDGKALRRWYGNQRSLPVFTNAGDDLNAFYNRASLQFFAHTYDGVTVHSAESVDVVVHEQGHALLDAIRPDFFDVPFIEVGALHESFGDCLAMLTALTDRSIRDSVVGSSPDLSKQHFLESLAEQLGDAIRREYGSQSVEAGALRHARNRWQWSDPTSLPSNAPADELSGEVHSFSRVFTGAFYDLIRNLYLAGNRNSTGLKRAGQTAGQLLISAIRTVPATPGVFAGLGRRILQADVSANKGVNAAAIRSAFEAHGMPLGAAAASLPEPVGKQARGIQRTLRERMAVPSGTPLKVTPVDSDMHGPMAHVAAFRPLPLDGEGLVGVRVLVPAVARVSRRGRSITGVLGEVTPAGGDVDVQARAFARSLVANGDVQTAPRAARRLTVAPTPTRPRATASHEIRIVGGQPTLVRVGFSHRG